MSSSYIYFAIILSAIATYLPRILGAMSSAYVDENGKIFKFVSCISYGILAALISRIFIYPVGALEETAALSRLIAAALTIACLFMTRKNVLFSSLFGIILFGIIEY